MKVSTHALLLDAFRMFNGEKAMTVSRASKLNSYRTILVQNNASGCRAMVAVSRVILIMRLREFGSYMDSYYGRPVAEETSAKLATLVPEYRVLYDRARFLLRSVIKNWNEFHSSLLPSMLTLQIQDLRIRVASMVDEARQDRFSSSRVGSLKQQVTALPPIPFVDNQPVKKGMVPEDPVPEGPEPEEPVPEGPVPGEPIVVKPLFSEALGPSDPLENLKKIQEAERK